MRVKYKDGGKMCSCGKPKYMCGGKHKRMAMGGTYGGGGEADPPEEPGEGRRRFPGGGGLRFRSQPMDMPQYDPDPAQRRFNKEQVRVEEGLVGALNRTARGMDRAGMDDYQAVDVLLNTLNNVNREDLARAGRRRRTAKQVLPLAAMAAAGLGGAGLAMQSKASLAGRSLPFGRAVLAALGIL